METAAILATNSPVVSKKYTHPGSYDITPHLRVLISFSPVFLQRGQFSFQQAIPFSGFTGLPVYNISGFTCAAENLFIFLDNHFFKFFACRP
jgi:hypothetical protein